MSLIEDNEKILLKAFDCKCIYDFKIALVSLQNQLYGDNRHFNDFESFADVLSTPRSGKFIKLCFKGGASFYKKTSSGKFPLEIVFKSRCKENILTLLELSKKDENIVKFNEILNLKLEGKNTFLHCLAYELSIDNCELSFDLMNIFVQFGCSHSLRNHENLTPSDIVESSLIHADKKRNLLTIFHTQRSIKLLGGEFSMYDHMLELINCEKEEEFIQSYPGVENNLTENVNNSSHLLERAIVKNLPKVAEMIIKDGMNLNFVSTYSEFGKEPAFLAASLGRTEIFTSLIANQNVKFYSELAKNNLLHEILNSKHVELNELEKMISLVAFDSRCTSEIINAEDKNSKSPLYYACVNQFDSITKFLLKKGAYIGSKEIVDALEPELVEEFLDQCTMRMKDDEDEKIFIDYQFLVPPKVLKVPKSEALKNIAENPQMINVLRHPVLTSFLGIKWDIIKWLYAIKSLIHFSMLFFLAFNLSFAMGNERKFSTDQNLFIKNTFLIIFFTMTIIEIVQIFTSFRTYFFKFGNWLDMITVGSIFYIIISTMIRVSYYYDNYSKEHTEQTSKAFTDNITRDIRITGAFQILLIAAQSLRIFGFSIYTTMFKKVSFSFIKLILMYLFLFVTFAMSFHILHKADNKNNFINDEVTGFSKSVSDKLELIPLEQNSNHTNSLADMNYHFYELLQSNIATKGIMNYSDYNISYHLNNYPILFHKNELLTDINLFEYTDHDASNIFQYQFFLLNSLFFSQPKSTENTLNLLNDEESREFLDLMCTSFQNYTANFTKLLDDQYEEFNVVVQKLEKSSLLKPGGTCAIKFTEIENFINVIADVKRHKTLKTSSLCSIAEESRKDFVKNVLKIDLSLNVFKLCDISVNNVEDLLSTLFDLEISDTATFATFCDISEPSRREILLKMFEMTVFSIDNVTEFCKTHEKTSESALKAFFDLKGNEDVLKLENVCSDKSNGWLGLKNAFGLKDSSKNSTMVYCDYDERFMREILRILFSEKSHMDFDVKELYTVKTEMIYELIELGIVRVKSSESEVFDPSEFDEICNAEIENITEDFDGFDALKGINFDTIIEKNGTYEMLCNETLNLGVDFLIRLFSFERKDAELLGNFCKRDGEYFSDWMKFFSTDKNMMANFDEVCQWDVKFREEILKANSFQINNEMLHKMCKLKAMRNEEKTEDFEDSDDEENDDDYARKILEGVFEKNKACRLSSETLKDILENIFDDFDGELCKIDQNDLNYQVKNGEKISENLSYSHENPSVAENLCKIGSNSRIDFLTNIYGFENATVSFLDSICLNFNDVKEPLEIIRNIEENLFTGVLLACKIDLKTREELLKTESNLKELNSLNKFCEKNESDRNSIEYFANYLLYRIELKPENFCQIDKDSREYFLSKFGGWGDDKLSRLESVCKEITQEFLKEKSSFVYEFKGVTIDELCKINGDYRKNFMKTFFDFKNTKIDKIEGICTQNSSLSFVEKAEIIFGEDFDSIRPKHLFKLNKTEIVEKLEAVIGIKKLKTDEIKLFNELYNYGYEFLFFLEKMVFQRTLSEYIQPGKLCRRKQNSQNELLQNIFDVKNPENLNLPKLCETTKFSLKYILQIIYDFPDPKSLHPSELCSISKKSREDIMENILKFSTEHFKQMNNFCKIDSTWHNKLLTINPKAMVTPLKNLCREKILWRSFSQLIFGHENCSFLTLEKVCPEIVLNLNVLRKNEVDNIDKAVNEINGTFMNIFELTAEILQTYQDLEKILDRYKIVALNYDNFGTIQISIFRTFTMLAGELNSDKFNESSRMVMLLLFIFFMTITLQNLMNSIALIDAQAILNEAEIIGTKKRISLVFSYEKLLEKISWGKFEIFSSLKLNRFVLTPSKGRGLIRFDSQEVSKVEMLNILGLNNNSMKNIEKFLDTKNKIKVV